MGRKIGAPSQEEREVVVAWIKGELNTQRAAERLGLGYSNAGLVIAHAIRGALPKDPALARRLVQLL